MKIYLEQFEDTKWVSRNRKSRYRKYNHYFDFRIKRYSVRLFLQLFVGGLMSCMYLRYLCLFVHSAVQHILCCVFGLFVVVLCLVYPMLPVSLDCPFVITPSVFSNIYFILTSNKSLYYRQSLLTKEFCFCHLPKMYNISIFTIHNKNKALKITLF